MCVCTILTPPPRYDAWDPHLAAEAATAAAAQAKHKTMRYGQSLASYLPSTVVSELSRTERAGAGAPRSLYQEDLPIRQELPGGAVCAFFDIR